MTDTYFYPEDPGDDVLLGKGSVRNIVEEAEPRTAPAFGYGVLGLIGSVINDRGQPEVPVELSNGPEDIGLSYGGYRPWFGGDETTGYNANLAAYAHLLEVPRAVLVPVDLALRTGSIADESPLLARIARGVVAFSVATDGTITITSHGYLEDDTFEVVSISTGTGLTAGSTYHVISSGLTTNAFKGSTTQGGSAQTHSASATGYLRPIAKAAASFEPFTLRAGTRIQTAGGAFIVHTLEDLSWARNAFDAQDVRLGKVSGTEAAISTLASFVDTLSDTTVRLITPTTDGTPEAIDTAEWAVRYTRAAAALESNDAGLGVDVLACDRTDALVLDAISVQAADAVDSGHFYDFIVAPPIGTEPASAQGSGSDGSLRSTIVGKRRVGGVYPGWTRTFLLDKARLKGPNYKARFAGAIPMAAAMCTILPERNPARPNSVIQRWGASGLERVLSLTEREANWRANLMTTEMRKVRVGQSFELRPAHRDGVMLDGSKVANSRLFDYLAQGISMCCEDFHQDVGSLARRNQLEATVDSWLATLQTPPQGGTPRIAGRSVKVTWNAETEQATVKVVVKRLGNMDVITIRLRVTADAVTLDQAA